MSREGFTLIEMLFTMILFVGLTVIGLGSYFNFTKKNEQQTIIDELRTAIQFAKFQSIVLGNSVFLSPVNSSLNWSNGMILTTLDRKLNKSKLIYQWQWYHPGWSLNWVGAGSTNKITFSNNPVQAISNGRFSLINKYTHQRVEIILNRLGRIRVTYDNESRLLLT